MKRWVNFIIASLILVIIILLLITHQTQNKLNQLEQEKTTLTKQLAQTQRPTVSANEIFLLAQKERELATIKKTQLYFTSQLEKLTSNQWRVTIYLAGDDKSAADGADLWFDYSDNLKITEIKTGTAFPLYPRQVIETNHLLITGLASIIDTQITYGKPGKVFVQFTITNNNQSGQNILKLNFNETKIFLNGDNLFDTENTVKQIELD